jgi:dTDP-4-dehydrorhamnose reductase
VTGASGLLGLNLCLEKWETHSIVGVDRGKLHGTPFELFRADLTQPETVSRFMDTLRPEAVIHTAALANLEACEADPQLAGRLNADMPGEIAIECARRNIRLIHISTDAVFDGTLEREYTESDPPSPLGVYSQTKLAGERNVLSANPQAIVARVNFFGWSLSGTRSLSEFFFNKLSAGEQCNGFTDVYFCPLFVGDLAKTLVLMLDKGLAGLYHVVGSEALSKYEFGQRIARQFGFNPRLVIPRSVEESGLKARRSHNLRLSIHKLSTDLGREIPGVSTGIEQFYTQAQQGYPQKMRSYQQI